MIFCDNHSAIQVAEDHVAHIKMKYVKLHAHYPDTVSAEWCCEPFFLQDR